MFDERGARRDARGGIDVAIDRAARAMLDAEPPPGLRGRVMDRIESPRHGIAWTWVAAPVAAAAVIVLAVTAPWREAVPATPVAPPVVAPAAPPMIANAQPTRVIAPVETPTAPAPGTRRIVPRLSETLARKPARSTALARMGVAAANAAAVEDMNFTAIAALAGPESIAIERLADPLPSSMYSIEPAPLQIRAIEIAALQETPRERREE